MTPGYIVMTASAQMPASCKGIYRRVAVAHVADIHNPPKMISDRAKGMLRLVETWERLHVGTSARCAYERALAEANGLCATLNAGSTQRAWEEASALDAAEAV